MGFLVDCLTYSSRFFVSERLHRGLLRKNNSSKEVVRDFGILVNFPAEKK
jgi:hypothetical protein